MPAALREKLVGEEQRQCGSSILVQQCIPLVDLEWILQIESGFMVSRCPGRRCHEYSVQFATSSHYLTRAFNC